jgi:radical SAM protein with 4Fe4S-binding SPASM domain
MHIAGGDPFLRKDLFEIIQAAIEAGFSVHVLTNGTLVDRVRARRLAGLGVAGVQVSIEGPEDVHDGIRGEGSFAAAAAGIERLVDEGLAVTVNTTLSALNADVVAKTVAFASHAGVRRMNVSRFVPIGRGRALLDRMLPRERIRELYDRLLSRELFGLEIVSGDPVAAQMSDRDQADCGSTALCGCAAGVSGLTIQASGNITPCRRLPLSLGNIRRDSLREVWATAPVLEALRDRSRYRGRCGACRRWAVCRGCRAIAYAYARSRGSDDFLADDPQCFLA